MNEEIQKLSGVLLVLIGSALLMWEWGWMTALAVSLVALGYGELMSPGDDEDDYDDVVAEEEEIDKSED